MESYSDHYSLLQEQSELLETSLYMSDSGLKNLSHSTYNDKFKGLHWTTDLNQELPIKVQEENGFGNEKPITLSLGFLQNATRL